MAGVHLTFPTNCSWVNGACLLHTRSWVFDCFSFETAQGCACPKHLRQTDLWIRSMCVSGESRIIQWESFLSQCLPFLDYDHAVEFAASCFVCGTHCQVASRCMNNNNKDAVNSHIKKESYLLQHYNKLNAWMVACNFHNTAPWREPSLKSWS